MTQLGSTSGRITIDAMQPAEASGLPVSQAMPRLRPGEALRWFAANLVAERERWALWVPVFVGAGIGIYFWLTVEPPLWLGAFAAAAAMAAAVAALRSQRLVPPAVPAAPPPLRLAPAPLPAGGVAAPLPAPPLRPAA